MEPVRASLTRLGTRLLAALLLWAPLLLWLVGISPPQNGLGVHLATATALAFISSSALRVLFAIPTAPPGPGRHRVLPTAPNRPLLIASLGISSLGWGLWRVTFVSPEVVGFTALVSGAMAMWMALRWRGDPLWGTWLEVVGDVLRVHCPRAEDWSVPLVRALAVHRRPADGSFLLETPWPERDVFVPSPGARARYIVTNHVALFQQLCQVVPIKETPLLMAVLRQRRAEARDA